MEAAAPTEGQAAAPAEEQAGEADQAHPHAVPMPVPLFSLNEEIDGCKEVDGMKNNDLNVVAATELPLSVIEPSSSMQIPAASLVDWDTIQIEESHDEEGRLEMPSEQQMHVLLGLREEDERAEKAREDAANPRADACGSGLPNILDIEGAAIPVDDSIPGEHNFDYDENNPIMRVGIKYRSMKEFRLAMRQYAINKEFELGIEATDPNRYRGFCLGGDCPWSIHARPIRLGAAIVEVIVLNDIHTCTSSSRRRTTTPTTPWVAAKALPILRKKPNMGAKELQTTLQDAHGCIIVYETAWRGLQRALKTLYGVWEESFKELYCWRAEVLKKMPNSVIEIDTEMVHGHIYFRKFFCALGPCIEGFLDGCRPYISIDSTALNGKWNGHLASAVGVDGHNWMYPIAYCFFDGETEVNWTWFMSQLHKAIGDLPVLAICTDAHKALISAVKTIFPNAEHRECMVHLVKNYVKNANKFTCEELLYPAARAYKREVHDHLTSTILSDPQVSLWFEQHHNLKWTRCKFKPAIKCDYITNNIAESFNNWIEKIKDLPVCELADKLREMIMVLHFKRRKIGERLTGNILPAVLHILRARTRGLQHLSVVQGDHYAAEVRDNTNCLIRHVVKAYNHECSCEEWQHTGKPCTHALCVITSQPFRDVRMEHFVHHYYSVEMFKNAYKRLVEPLPDRTQWPKVDIPTDLGAPLDKRSVGRQRKKRFKSCLEGGGGGGGGGGGKKPSQETEKAKKRIRGQVTCPKCGLKGHRQNSPKCPLNGTKKRKRKPRKNTTKGWFPKEVSAPPMAANTNELEDNAIVPIQDSPTFIGEGTSSQVANIVTSTPTKQPTPKRAVRKITPKKAKRA